MKRIVCRILIFCVLVCLPTPALTIPPQQLDASRIYLGSPTAFEQPGEIQYDSLIRATPEFKLIEAKKIPRGSGKYWILQAKGADRVIRTCKLVAVEGGVDLIARSGYLGSLTPPVPATDITTGVESRIKTEFENTKK